MNDDTAFSARHDTDGPVETRLLLQQDGARHDRVGGSSPGHSGVVMCWRHGLDAAHARALVDELVCAGGGDLVDDLARPLTERSVADLIGMPTEQRSVSLAGSLRSSTTIATSRSALADKALRHARTGVRPFRRRTDRSSPRRRRSVGRARPSPRSGPLNRRRLDRRRDQRGTRGTCARRPAGRRSCSLAM